MKKILLSSLLLAVLFAKAQPPSLEWAKQIGGPPNELGLAMNVDLAGNIYSAGAFGGTMDFDPGPATLNITSIGSVDAFITKSDPSGNLIWAKTFGGTLTFVYGITTDASGNLYLTGSFQDTTDFDPGASTFNLISAGSWDSYISKWDAAGNFLWAKSVGSLGTNDAGYDVAVDINGNVHIAGTFNQTVDFDPGSGTNNITAAGSSDSYILKLDASGNFVWAKGVGGTSSDQVQSLVIDGAGSVYFTGNFFGTCDFNPGSGTFNLTSAGSADAFICKLDVSGNFAWAMKAGANSDDRASSIALDNSGNTLTTGFFDGVVDFDPGPAVNNLSSAFNSTDAFVVKLDSSGNYIWAKKTGGNNYDSGRNITSDANGNVYFSGYYTGTVDFDPDTSSYLLPGHSSGDLFISKLDAAGNFVWAVGFGSTTPQDFAEEIIVDAAGKVYCIGNFEGTGDFDPGPSNLNFISAGVGDVYIMKFTQTPLGTSENLTKNDFTIYPNPAHQSLVISHGSLKENCEMSVFNVMGKEIFKTSLNDEKTEIDVSKLESGLYFVQLTYSSSVGLVMSTQKLIIQ